MDDWIKKDTECKQRVSRKDKTGGRTKNASWSSASPPLPWPLPSPCSIAGSPVKRPYQPSSIPFPIPSVPKLGENTIISRYRGWSTKTLDQPYITFLTVSGLTGVSLHRENLVQFSVFVRRENWRNNLTTIWWLYLQPSGKGHSSTKSHQLCKL